MGILGVAPVNNSGLRLGNGVIQKLTSLCSLIKKIKNYVFSKNVLNWADKTISAGPLLLL